jgi:prepilin-type N-terminal cleavage/methylation domain-containing protein/prepilin-type processing-associated H-X9-DG protein
MFGLHEEVTMGYCRRKDSAFSLVELLVVIGIIGLLITVLMPLLAKVRKMSRSTACLSHLHQWGQCYQMYLSANHGHTLEGPSRVVSLSWWEQLAPYNGNLRASLLCPEAADAVNTAPFPNQGVRVVSVDGFAQSAWRLRKYSVGSPQWIPRGDYTGSYGLNNYVYDYTMDRRRYPPGLADRMPLIGDCCSVDGTINGSPPRNLQGQGGTRDGSGANFLFCIDRHQMAINIVFLDGHAEHVPLAGLWLLSWNPSSVPQNVVIPVP